MDDIFSRSELLLGGDGLDKLARARVAVAGIGGVGSFAAEALIRAGVGGLLFIDHDVVSLSNCNRQLHATVKTVGMYKTLLMAERAREINPAVTVETREEFITPENCGELLSGGLDYIIDAVDNVTAKLAIITLARERGIPVISAMGAGNRLDPSRFRVTDIYSTSGCPLSRVMRRELRARGVEALDVVFSDEPPAASHRPPGSVSFVPPVSGMIAGGYVVRKICGM
jgi:tRNA A37 threonylcarbamoyladenosine dehydratase